MPKNKTQPITKMSVEVCPNGTAHFKNENNSLNTNIYPYLETSGGQSFIYI